MAAIFEDREAWLAHYRANFEAHFHQTGEADFKRYQRVRNRESVSSPAIDVRASRVALITSSGAYLRAEQPPFDAENDLGDYTLRLIPAAAPLDALAFAHTHYDHAAVDADAQVLVPLRHLEVLAAEGAIGSFAPTVISFMGYQPDAARVVDETIPALAAAVRDQGAQAALLVPS